MTQSPSQSKAANDVLASKQRPKDAGFLVLDYGSQYTMLIARRLRELGHYAEIVDGTLEQPPEGFEIKGIILSGGPDSVLAADGRRLPAWVLDLITGHSTMEKELHQEHHKHVPVLGICYGLQLLVHHFGGSIRSGKSREYGRSELRLDENTEHGKELFTDVGQTSTVWMSHGDDIEGLDQDWESLGHTDDGVVAAVVHREKALYGLQFHPEVEHTEFGKEILRAFAQEVCKVERNWQLEDMTTATINQIRETVGDGRVLVAVSGGVDSTVAARLMIEALGAARVTAVFVDHGLLRKDEASWVVDKLKGAGIEQLHLLDKQDLFLGKLAGKSDPEEKRKIIGRTFIECFESFANEHQGEFTHLGQGTLYPDVIESAGHGAGAKVIKSHHNVGGLPERLALDLVEPFRFLFKDEVRRIGDKLEIPFELVHRHPFPGPGLAVRILGDLNKENIRVLQEADDIFVKALKEEGYYDKVWQAFAVLLPVHTVGVMGDQRTYQKACALRAVTAIDGMTAGVGVLPMEFLTRVADKIVRKVDGINRVVYDITSKPPGTIEWE